ncbi:uncharacterized protein BO87DRAFT_380109 [Aspergillus neoniger CBS 115656]|uniref:Uncharacterized protein n=1 Tax=Aspergillus neoniger (strain CBS 115656) TaxID=1448310 RepID=A0A318YPM0_ASPNB|nr:hypothetical protein BO87DRAFT_380109 [Aspergillus neoniger CBS 115656]PYH30128.1 hypothetical protein BO87DRAFT_380109 [Aspergillus neoniger CBS 115656]
MQLFSAFTFTVATTLLTSVHGTATIGQACSGSSTYDCTDDFNAVAICNGARWVEAAQCGGGCCAWPLGDPAPFCSC